MSDLTHHDHVAHHEGAHHEAEHHETDHWLERNWGFLVIGFGLICVYFLDTFAPTL